MAGGLICLLEGLVFFAVVCLVLYVLWWGFTSIIAALEWKVPPPIFVILRVIAVLILVILLVQMLLSGQWCGFFGWSGALHR